MAGRKANAAPAANVKTVVVSAASGLNLRAGPSVAFDSLSILTKGTKLEVIDTPAEYTFPGWLHVHAGKLKGWVKEAFIYDDADAHKE